MTALSTTYAGWAPVRTQVTSVAGSNFLYHPPFNPAARTGYAWPVDNAFYVPWPPGGAASGGAASGRNRFLHLKLALGF